MAREQVPRPRRPVFTCVCHIDAEGQRAHDDWVAMGSLDMDSCIACGEIVRQLKISSSMLLLENALEARG